jgi:hypothetical protein
MIAFGTQMVQQGQLDAFVFSPICLFARSYSTILAMPKSGGTPKRAEIKRHRVRPAHHHLGLASA